ncbi:MAG: 1-deoxy-D-xylulose-5-phosphate reductoisomerase, partial [Bryobacteraceae bacterium]
TPVDQLERVTPVEALRHPTWKMGRRITIDSATLMNKGFEVMEACWLFGLGRGDVDVVIHPQSAVHAMVEYRDGSIVAQASATDMRMPIQYALTWPDRLPAPVPRLDWSGERVWEFSEPEPAKFPLLKLAREALESGDAAGCTLNAADEIAVEAFLNGGIGFTGIARVVERTLESMPRLATETIAAVQECDAEARRIASEIVRRSAARIVSS